MGSKATPGVRAKRILEHIRLFYPMVYAALSIERRLLLTKYIESEFKSQRAGDQR